MGLGASGTNCKGFVIFPNQKGRLRPQITDGAARAASWLIPTTEVVGMGFLFGFQGGGFLIRVFLYPKTPHWEKKSPRYGVGARKIPLYKSGLGAGGGISYVKLA